MLRHDNSLDDRHIPIAQSLSFYNRLLHLLQVVVGPNRSKRFCPMLLLMLLAMAADLQEFFEKFNAEKEEMLFKDLLRPPSMEGITQV